MSRVVRIETRTRESGVYAVIRDRQRHMLAVTPTRPNGTEAVARRDAEELCARRGWMPDAGPDVERIDQREAWDEREERREKLDQEGR